MTLDGLCSACSMAASSIGLYLTMRFGSMPQEAETMAFGLASLMRVASSCGAKPPNTTEWTAPRRAQPSMATTDCGIIGMYRMTRSPFSTPWARSAPAKRAT